MAALGPVLNLTAVRPLDPASLRVVIARTADLDDEDFDAAVDWLADHADETRNPIPPLRRAAAEHAKGRRQTADDARRAEERVQAVPMPEDVRARIERLKRRGAAP